MSALNELFKIKDREMFLNTINKQLENLCSYSIIKRREIFANNSDSVDDISSNLLRCFSKVDQTELRPIEIRGDGNCLFRAISKSIYGQQEAHAEIRYRTIVELAMKADQFLDYVETNENISYFNMISPSSEKLNNAKEILWSEIIKCSKIEEWCSIWHIFGAAQAMKIDINQIHPKVDLKMASALNMKILSFSNESQGKIILKKI